MSLFFGRYMGQSPLSSLKTVPYWDAASSKEAQQLKGGFVNGRYQRTVSTSPKREQSPTTQKVKKVVQDAPAKSPTKTTFFVPSKQPSKPSPLVKRTEIARPSSPPNLPTLALATQSKTLLSTLPASCRALRVFSSNLEAAGSNQEVWSAVSALKGSSPQAAEFLNQWLLDTIHEIPSRTSNEVNTFLRSQSGKIMIEELIRAFEELQPKVNTLKQYIDLYRAFERSPGRPDQFKSKLWDPLPKEVQSTLSRQVFDISRPTRPVDHFGRTEIEKKPSILYSLNGRNILQEQIQQLEQEFTPVLTRHLEVSRKKCLTKLLNVDDTAYRDQLRFATREIRQLKSLQAVLKNYSLERRNEALSQFFKLHEQTTGALLHAIWIADDSPMVVKNRDPEHGLHLLESNPTMLLNISEDSVDGSLIDWAIQFYENQAKHYETISTLEALEKKFDSRVSSHTLLWAFNSCDKTLIQDPLIDQMSSYGYDEEAFRSQPRILVTSPSFDGLSPLAALIAKKKKECELSITEPVKQAKKIQEGFDSTGGVVEDIGVERFADVGAISERFAEAQKIAILTPEFSKFYDAGGLAPAIFGLAKSLAERGQTEKVIMPYYYELLPEALRNAAVEKPEYEIRDGTAENGRCKVMKISMDHPEVAKLFGLKQEEIEGWAKNVRFYMIAPSSEHTKTMFKKAYGGPGEIKRFAFFQSAAIELLNKMNTDDKHGGKKIDVFHANDWATSLVSQGMQLRYQDRVLPSVFAVHNSAYSPTIDAKTINWARLRQGQVKPLNTFVEGLLSHNQVVTVSRNYAKEIQTKQLGFGLDSHFRYVAKNGRLNGIVNGNNTAMHDPSTDRNLQNWVDPVTGEHIDLRYSMDDPLILEKKQRIKEQLQKWFDLYYPEVHMDLDSGKPLFFYVGRLVDQKGLDLLEPMIDKIIAEGGQFVGIGMGDDTMQPITKAFLLKLKRRVKEKWGKAGAAFIFDEMTLHKTTGARVRKYQQGDGVIPGFSALLRAATDLFLMPSKFEPCGLTQGEAKRYGTTLTIATETGGLVDTETTVTTAENPTEVTAFLCPRVGNYHDWHKPAQMKAFVNTIGNAMKFYRQRARDPVAMRASMKYVMDSSGKSSWTETPDRSEPPVDQYRRLYSAAQVLPRPHRRAGARLSIGFGQT